MKILFKNKCTHIKSNVHKISFILTPFAMKGQYIETGSLNTDKICLQYTFCLMGSEIGNSLLASEE